MVSKDPDATAAEVARSVDLYDQARRDLSGYQVVLDLLVARHFGLSEAQERVSHGSDLNLADRESFLESLHDNKEHRLVSQVEDLARCPNLCFFHWEIEFPEVFFGLMGGTTQQLRHKNKMAPGSAGFDVVVGNPPSVRQETIKPYKAFLKETFTTYDSTNDLYVFFQEQEIRQLRGGGRMGMIVANKWMRAGYGERLRDFLQRVGRPLEVIDFGHSPIFPDADTFPCILIVAKRARALAEKERPAEDEKLSACEVPREHWSDRMDLGAFVSSRRRHLATSLLRREGWSLGNPLAQLLLEKLRAQGVPLAAYCRQKPMFGIKTGLTEAYVIDGETRAAQVRKRKTPRESSNPFCGVEISIAGGSETEASI
jgi:hypothetical protein